MSRQEKENIEYKEVVNESIAKEIVAFLNTHYGIIYIGMNNDGEIVGVNNVDKSLRRISDLITDQISPNPQEYIAVTTKEIDEKDIIVIEVNKGNNLYYIKKYGRSVTGCYIRIGSSSKPMLEEQIAAIYASYISVKEIKMKDIPLLRKDFTFNKFKKYLIAKEINFNERNFLNNFNLITEEGKFNLLGELLADENMISIKVAVFKGRDKSEFIKRNEYGNTCLIYALEQVLNYCESLNETYVDLSVSPRREKKMFNFEAFKEAWINACVHNKWVEGIPPAIYWFKDRVEIISYGGIPNGLSKEEFLSGKTRPVNKELMNIFLQCDIVEQSGHGVPLIVREYGESSYKFSENSITVVIPFDKIGFGKECGAVNDSSGAENTLSGAENGAVNDVSGAENTLSGAENGAVNEGSGAENTLSGAVNGAVNEVSGAENILSGAENGAVNDVSGAENLIEEEKIKKTNITIN